MQCDNDTEHGNKCVIYFLIRLAGGWGGGRGNLFAGVSRVVIEGSPIPPTILYRHRRNNPRDRGRLVPQLLASEFSKILPRRYPRTLTAGGGDPLPHPTPSPAFGKRPGVGPQGQY